MSCEPDTIDLLDKLLTLKPAKRITAVQALDHNYFWTEPLPADPGTLPKYEASHELDKRHHHGPPPGMVMKGPDPARHGHGHGPGHGS